MNKINYSNQSKQIGIAALLVTVMLALIAGVATIYVNRSGLLLQRSVINNTQGVMANQAAEAGINAFITQLQIDIAKLDINAFDTTTTLIAKAPAGGASSCAPGGGTFPFVFKSPYADSTAIPTNTRFLPSQYYTNSINLLNAITNTNPSLSYKVQAAIIGNIMHIRSNGLANGTDASSIIRKSVKIKSGFTVGGAGITIGGYTDAQGDIDVLNWADSPVCAVQYGDTYNVDLSGISGGAGVTPIYQCATGTCPPQSMGIPSSNLFQSMFGMTKIEMESIATSVTTTCPPYEITSNKIIVINGDINGYCQIGGSNNLIILNGNLTGTGGIQADGLAYVNNLYQNGSLMITGSIAIEGNWDKGALGTMYTNADTGLPVANTRIDSKSTSVNMRTTHSATGSLNVSYKKYIPPPPPPGERIIISGSSWIDF